MLYFFSCGMYFNGGQLHLNSEICIQSTYSYCIHWAETGIASPNFQCQHSNSHPVWLELCFHYSLRGGGGGGGGALLAYLDRSLFGEATLTFDMWACACLDKHTASKFEFQKSSCQDSIPRFPEGYRLGTGTFQDSFGSLKGYYVFLKRN